MSQIAKATVKALAAQKHRSMQETRAKLELALQRLTTGQPKVLLQGTKITAASVAKEAQVDRATLYRFHEPILTEIRKITDSSPRAKLKESRSDLALTNAKLKEYRQLVENAQAEVSALARINYGLDARCTELQELIRVRDERIAHLQKQLNVHDSRSRTMKVRRISEPL